MMRTIAAIFCLMSSFSTAYAANDNSACKDDQKIMEAFQTLTKRILDENPNDVVVADKFGYTISQNLMGEFAKRLLVTKNETERKDTVWSLFVDVETCKVSHGIIGYPSP